ncbi:class I SAM-dependent methyltransferase [Ectothiorhodospiraceae bacterium BW-2]|nr:class I SAM-dependent methyltransferase [Ectothiorhodospiraceae bacterium BW-2]
MENKYYIKEKKFWDNKGTTDYCSLSEFDQKRIYQWIGWSGNGKVLDIGGGSGMISRIISDMPNTEAFCVDISLSMLQHSVVTSIQADALRLPFKNDSFDMIIAAAFFHHLPGREFQLLCEMHRVLRPGGRVIAYDPSADCLQNRFFMSDGFFRLNMFSPDELPLYPKHIERYATQCGFSSFSCKLFSFRNSRLTIFEFIQRYILSPIAIGPLEKIFERWFFWEVCKKQIG